MSVEEDDEVGEEEGMRAKRCLVSAATMRWSSGKVTLRVDRRCQESWGDG